LLKAADVAVSAAATPEAVRHIRASFDFVEPDLLPRLHERIGDLTAGDSGLEEYRLALEEYQECGSPVDDQLRALAGMLMVATRWAGSVGDRPSEEWMGDLRDRGRGLLKKATDRYSIARFLAADAFFPFWAQGIREPTAAERAQAEKSVTRAMEIATELDDPELMSVVLDAEGGLSTAVNDWPRARETAEKRIAFEAKLSLYERLDAHSMMAWMSYFMADLETSERDSAQMMARLLPGQAPYPSLHLFAWRVLTLYTLGRWDEAATVFWRAVEAWHDAGSHSAGYALRGFAAGLAIGRARNDSRLVGAAITAMEAILAGFQLGTHPQHPHAVLLEYLRGESGLRPDDPYIVGQYPWEMADLRIALACDRRDDVSREILEEGLTKAVRIRVPLVEAQIRRARGLAHRDAGEFTAALAIWERAGALPYIGRALAERGLITGDVAETETGLAMLKKLGDLNYADKFSLLPIHGEVARSAGGAESGS
jgi:tetratricopeptide (TPR) repeat protein